MDLIASVLRNGVLVSDFDSDDNFLLRFEFNWEHDRDIAYRVGSAYIAVYDVDEVRVVVSRKPESFCKESYEGHPRLFLCGRDRIERVNY